MILSPKDVEGASWAVTREQLVRVVSQLYRGHQQTVAELDPEDRAFYERLCLREGTDADLAASLRQLVLYLYRSCGKPVLVLIDEYDSPVIEAWRKGYYAEMIDFMRDWLGGGLELKRDLEKLLLGEELRHPMVEHTVFEDIGKGREAIWSQNRAGGEAAVARGAARGVSPCA